MHRSDFHLTSVNLTGKFYPSNCPEGHPPVAFVLSVDGKLNLTTAPSQPLASAPPCPACETSTTVVKNGHRYTKRGISQRWMCKACANSWTQNSAVHRMTEMGGRDRTPEINQRIWELAMSGVTMRRIAVLVGCTRRTVSRKLHYLSIRAWAYHAEHGPKTSWAMMDELETFMGARWRQITVAVVIRAKTREILAVSVGPVSSTMDKGKAAGWTKDTRVATSRDAFGNAAPFIKLPALTLRYPYHHKGR
jgi:transposase-like protein